jgi:4-diphosphocytidyl-2C-methyl-D-erythritol kinase
MQGRGEILDTVKVPLGLPFLVVMAPFGLATPDVYRMWDEMGGPESARSVPPPRALSRIVGPLYNDLEPAAEELEPRLIDLRHEIEDATGTPALLAGSGSSFVVPVDVDGRRLPDLAAELGQRLRRPVMGAATVSRGVRIEA